MEKECPTEILSNENLVERSKLKFNWLEIFHLRKIFVCKSWLYLEAIRRPRSSAMKSVCVLSVESEGSRRCNINNQEINKWVLRHIPSVFLPAKKKIMGDSQKITCFLFILTFIIYHDISRTVYKNKCTYMLIYFKYPHLI